MKVLFVTGGDDCKCKGGGIIEKGAHGPNHPREILHFLCECVEAREARVVTGGHSTDRYTVIPEDE